MPQNVSKTTTDHDTIRRWVEERGGWPAEVEATAGEDRTGIIRIDFPGWSGEGKLRRIDWDEWLRKFDEAGLAFVYEEETAGGERSNFNELVGRETAEARAEGVRTSRRASGRSERRTAKRGRTGGRKTAARGRTRKTAASRAGARRKASAGAGRKPGSGGRRVASRAAARTARGTSRKGSGRGTGRRGGGRTTRRSR